MAEPLLSVEGLTKSFQLREPRTLFGRRHHVLRAVSDVSFSLDCGEVLGVVGESGSGKTTVARMILRLIEPSAGRVLLRGRDIMSLAPSEVRSYLRPTVRMIFQDPDAALNPAYTVGAGLARAIRLHAIGKQDNVENAVASLLERLGMDGSYATKYPDELSGGEKRRIGICRALLTDPAIIVADEPLSGLDVVLQERVLALLKSEQEQRGFALILVSHDLDRVNQVCDRVLVMHGGRIVEQTTLRRNVGPIREQYRHPYSQLLQQARVDVGRSGADAVRAVPDGASVAETADAIADATVPAGVGCTFASVCLRREVRGNADICWTLVPPLVAVAANHAVACHFEHQSVGASVPGASLLPS